MSGFMASCTFFGHSELHFENPQEKLSVILNDLISQYGVDNFYVGNQGDFDRIVLNELRKLKPLFPQIRYSVVLAYHPTVNRYSEFVRCEETLFPEELENVSPRYSIAKRNEWMIARSQFAVVFVKYPSGGAEKYKRKAENKGLTVINVAEVNQKNG